ncbi:hypothetical protein GCM10025867_42500 [Frondihabitans sucicola]|uniref:Uncharacterized protein n=1 Tax=Frondihabitans sucicola TaxID=1268041 RepID=A0ABM8GUG5_9MICO|nr:hypothetical protein GCM10025867_42500 [Frondihabitans sucicola]
MREPAVAVALTLSERQATARRIAGQINAGAEFGDGLVVDLLEPLGRLGGRVLRCQTVERDVDADSAQRDEPCQDAPVRPDHREGVTAAVRVDQVVAGSPSVGSEPDHAASVDQALVDVGDPLDPRLTGAGFPRFSIAFSREPSLVVVRLRSTSSRRVAVSRSDMVRP